MSSEKNAIRSVMTLNIIVFCIPGLGNSFNEKIVFFKRGWCKYVCMKSHFPLVQYTFGGQSAQETACIKI